MNRVGELGPKTLKRRVGAMEEEMRGGVVASAVKGARGAEVTKRGRRGGGY